MSDKKKTIPNGFDERLVELLNRAEAMLQKVLSKVASDIAVEDWIADVHALDAEVVANQEKTLPYLSERRDEIKDLFETAEFALEHMKSCYENKCVPTLEEIRNLQNSLRDFEHESNREETLPKYSGRELVLEKALAIATKYLDQIRCGLTTDQSKVERMTKQLAYETLEEINAIIANRESPPIAAATKEELGKSFAQWLDDMGKGTALHDNLTNYSIWDVRVAFIEGRLWQHRAEANRDAGPVSLTTGDETDQSAEGQKK